LRARRFVGLVVVLGSVSLALARATSHPEPPRTADTCRAVVDSAVQDYMAARRLALLQCHSDTNEGRLRPRDCETEPHTAAALASAESTVLAALHRGCSVATVTSPPPAGIGAQFCGEDDACGFSFTALDDGTRDDRNDYVDCLLCLANDAVKTQIDQAYAGLTSSDPPRPVRECRERFTQAIIAFDTRRHLLEAHQTPRTASRVTEAQQKIATRLLARCQGTTDTVVTQSSPSRATTPSATAEADRTAQKH
jgi:hypothetical protein